MPTGDADASAEPRPGARRRSGPRPGQTESRRKILAAARTAFTANGYVGTSMRGIAREAGVDPSLIVHFFGTKAGLFAAVIEWPFDAAEIAAQVSQVPIDRLGEAWARQFIANWEQDERRNPIVSLLRAALADETAAKLLREFITLNFALPLVERAGGDQPQLRAALLVSQLMGYGLARYALGFEALADAPAEQMVAVLGENLQRWCTGPLPDPPSSG